LAKFLETPKHKVRAIASVLGKLISLEPALGKSVLVGTRLPTIAVVAATVFSEVSKRRWSSWESIIVLDDETMKALTNVSKSLDVWNGFPVRAWHTGISLSSILPYKAMALLDRKIPAQRIYDRRAIMASDASDFAVASYLVEGLPGFSLLSGATGVRERRVLLLQGAAGYRPDVGAHEVFTRGIAKAVRVDDPLVAY
jgi:hypothetical protein